MSQEENRKEEEEGEGEECRFCAERECRCCWVCKHYPCIPQKNCYRQIKMNPNYPNLPLPLSTYPYAASGVIQAHIERSVMNFAKFVPKRGVTPWTELYIDYINPNFVAREFVIKSKWVPPEYIPDIVVDDLKKHGIYDKMLKLTKDSRHDKTIDELMMLETMGYTRWKEVRKCARHKFEFTGRFNIHPVKQLLLRDLGIID